MNDEGELDIRWIQNERKEQFARGIVALSELSEDGAGGDLEKEVNFRLMLSSIQEDKETFLLTNIIIPDGKTKETD